MAALARRSFQGLRDELLRRLMRYDANTPDTTSQARAEHLIDAAYRLLAGFWHHHSLEESAVETLAVGTDSVALGALPNIVIGAKLFNQAQTVDYGRLLPKPPSYLFGKSQTSGRPKEYTRFAGNLHFDATADATYSVKVYYMRFITDPDFAGSATAETDRAFDELILEIATEIGHGTHWSPEASSQVSGWLGRWLALLPNPAIVGDTVRGKAAAPTEDRPPGGATG